MSKCFKCFLHFNHLKCFRTHIRHHGIEKSNAVYCVEDSCINKKFSNLSSFTQHFNTYHETLKTQIPSPELKNPRCSLDETDKEENVLPGFEGNKHFEDTSLDTLKTDIENLREAFNVFIPKLYKNPRIPKKEVQGIVENSQFLVQMIYSTLNPLIAQLKGNPQNIEYISELGNIIFYLQHPFQGLHSEYSRIKTFESEGTFIAPETCVIGEHLVSSSSSTHSLRPNELTAQFIPLRSMLKTLLEQPNVLHKIFDFHAYIQRNSNVLLNLMSGKAWKKHSNISGKYIFPLFLYSDDFECGN
ncbi:hypothetical protein AVEN_210298-1 [Araneus ventricosus]|uniref:C2H2-type domain-containing protein n=1 Tax=Araneus ventricosus TaxID=182803 RepID=A0A4Y2QJ54_ARAVE|nr:hypothetical protein AVEN_210298-1 [Araneus ventricosus]